MASRRDELNAYTFAKRRMLAAFVQPSATGSEEDAPRPLRGIVPSIVIGVVILAGFGAWGMIRPTAPQDWDKPGAQVIVASDSTTRYVVLNDDKGKKQLHPVLNMASAKLLLDDPDQAGVVKVAESVLDNGKIPHGATLGIPYAPDRVPDAKDAGTRKTWAVCQRPSGDGENVQKAAFVFAQRDRKLVAGRSQLTGGDLMYVQVPGPTQPDGKKSPGTRYVVDRSGTAYPLDDDVHIPSALGLRGSPEQVSAEWLATLHRGDTIAFPDIPGAGTPAHVSGSQLSAQDSKVGTVLVTHGGDGDRYYVVLQDRVAPISDFTEPLLLNDPDLVDLDQHGQPASESSGAFTASGQAFPAQQWPGESPHKVNSAKGGRDTVCSVLRDVDSKSDHTTVTTWAGTAFPAALATGTSSAYVTPGSGELFREPTGKDVKGGSVYLVTDTGLRYALHKSGNGTCKPSSGQTSSAEQTVDSKALLGYEKTDPTVVPSEWADFLPNGPGLSREAACEPQGS